MWEGQCNGHELGFAFEKLTKLYGRWTNKRLLELRVLHSYKRLSVKMAHHQFLLFCLSMALLPSRKSISSIPETRLPCDFFLASRMNRSTSMSVQYLSLKGLERSYFHAADALSLSKKKFNYPSGKWYLTIHQISQPLQLRCHTWDEAFWDPPAPVDLPHLITLRAEMNHPWWALLKFLIQKIMSNDMVTLNYQFWDGLLHGNRHQR